MVRMQVLRGIFLLISVLLSFMMISRCSALSACRTIHRTLVHQPYPTRYYSSSQFLASSTSAEDIESPYSPTYKQTFAGYQQPDTKHDAYVKAKEFNQNFPVIILVNPFLDQNVGSVARCMMNYGLTELRIVNPVCDITSDNCRALSAGAYSIVENAKLFKTPEEAIADLTRVMATSNRPRHMNQLVVTPAKAAEIALDRTSETVATNKVGVMFGRERDGLHNEELALADTMITIPTFNHFSSLNLAQAVNIIGYEMWKQHNVLQDTAPPELWLQPKDSHRLVRREELEQYFLRLERNLEMREFQIDPIRRATCFRDIRNIYRRVSETFELKL